MQGLKLLDQSFSNHGERVSFASALVGFFAGVESGAAHVLVLQSGSCRWTEMTRRHGVHALAQQITHRVVVIDFQLHRSATGGLEGCVAEVLSEAQDAARSADRLVQMAL